jgi:hypothetical protein
MDLYVHATPLKGLHGPFVRLHFILDLLNLVNMFNVLSVLFRSLLLFESLDIFVLMQCDYGYMFRSKYP